MAYNTMSVTRPKPYVVTNNRGSFKKNEDEESSKPSHAYQSQEERPQVKQKSTKTIQQQITESKASHKQATESRDANIKNATINIAQIIKDFKNTSKAIGASPELTEEVNEYLSLVEKQVLKESPDTKLIRSNLKNASTLLDNYITETLQRPSKVVENWIDALFLQQINYKFNEEDINPHFLVKFPNEKNKDEQSDSEEDEKEDKESSQDETKTETKSISVPQDEKLKSLFLQGKKYTYANNSKKAMELFKAALERSIEIEDNETESKVLFEIGKIYDKNDYLEQALSSYHKSLQSTKDLNVKTKAHYSMAQIYDDVAQFEPAINHYMSSISYAGENENFIAQSTSLTKIGNIYSDKYQKETFDFLFEAELLADESKSSKAMGYVSSNIANAYNRFNEPQKALKCYFSAIKDYQEAQSPLKVAINFKKAAEVMQDYNNPQKAKLLMRKALAKAQQANDAQLISDIHSALSMI